MMVGVVQFGINKKARSNDRAFSNVATDALPHRRRAVFNPIGLNTGAIRLSSYVGDVCAF
jgi:hypothetical protein